MALTDENMVMPVTPMNYGNNNGGFGFGGEDGDVPLGSGTLFLCSLAAAYMVRKGVRSKESFGR